MWPSVHLLKKKIVGFMRANEKKTLERFAFRPKSLFEAHLVPGYCPVWCMKRWIMLPICTVKKEQNYIPFSHLIFSSLKLRLFASAAGNWILCNFRKVQMLRALSCFRRGRAFLGGIFPRLQETHKNE